MKKALENELLEARDRRKQRDARWKLVIFVSAFVLWIGIWETLHISGLVRPIFISDPVSVLAALLDELRSPNTWSAVWSTFYASIWGLLLGGVIGITVGVVLSRSRLLQGGLQPYLTLFNAFPRPALAPIFILWFGLGAIPKIGIAFTIVVFVLIFNTLAGIENIDKDRIFLMKSFHASSWQTFILLEFPSALPSIVAGLRLGSVYSVLGVIVSEMVAANNGLGQLLVQYTNQFAIAQSFGILLIMAALAIILDFAVSIGQRIIHIHEF